MAFYPDIKDWLFLMFFWRKFASTPKVVRLRCVYIYIYISMDLCMLWIAHAYRLYAYITSFRSDRCTCRLCTQGMLQSWSCVGAASATFKKKKTWLNGTPFVWHRILPLWKVKWGGWRFGRRVVVILQIGLVQATAPRSQILSWAEFFFIDVKICQEVDIVMVDVGISLGGVGGRRHM